MFVFDTFQGFGRLTPGLDDIFGSEWFQDTTEEHVRHLFSSAGGDDRAWVLSGIGRRARSWSGRLLSLGCGCL